MGSNDQGVTRADGLWPNFTEDGNDGCRHKQTNKARGEIAQEYRQRRVDWYITQQDGAQQIVAISSDW